MLNWLFKTNENQNLDLIGNELKFDEKLYEC